MLSSIGCSERIALLTRRVAFHHRQSILSMPSAPTSTPTSAIESVAFGVASPESIREWSYGEVTNGRTIDEKTNRPVENGLFCDRIFGPVKDLECRCGTLHGFKNKGRTCLSCRVEVNEKQVRRERLGHIELAVPVAHIWFRKCAPSRIGLALGLPAGDIEKILNFEAYLVVETGQTPLKRHQLLGTNEFHEAQDLFGASGFIAKAGPEALRDCLAKLDLPMEVSRLQEAAQATKSSSVRTRLAKRIGQLSAFAASNTRPEWMLLTVLPILPPGLRPIVTTKEGVSVSPDLNILYRRVIHRNNRLKKALLEQAPGSEDLVRGIQSLQKAVDNLLDNGRSKPQALAFKGTPYKSLGDSLGGKKGRFRKALLGKRVDFSGRSVIVNGPQLKLHQCGLPKHLALELFQPFVLRELLRSAKASLVEGVRVQEATSPAEVRRILRSIFWDSHKVAIQMMSQVIKPDDMEALKALGPLAAEDNLVASRALESVLSSGPLVLINRAPTLHRHSIQAFEAVLVEGHAIQLHPLVCSAYNADFDGDLVAVHVPLSVEAQLEARQLMMASANLLNPSNGRLIVAPTQDIMLGCYCLMAEPHLPSDRASRLPLFGSSEEVHYAYDLGKLRVDNRIRFANPSFGNKTWKGDSSKKVLETTVGRVLFNEILPTEVGFINEPMGKKMLTELIEESYRRYGRERTALLLEQLKELGFRAATKAGVSIGIDDLTIPAGKAAVIEPHRKRVAKIHKLKKARQINERDRKINEEEHRSWEERRYQLVLRIWKKCSNSVAGLVVDALKNSPGKHGHNPVWLMLDSGARGSLEQVRQLTGMRGLMQKPNGELIERPILSNFREGLDSFEYFISTHGARKGLIDKSKRTGDAGYFMRKLVNLAHDVVVDDDDCQTVDGIWIRALSRGGEDLLPLQERLIGRIAAEDIRSTSDPSQILVAANHEITHDLAGIIKSEEIGQVKIRSASTCKSACGICATCYGRNFATDRPAALGDAVGIIATQSLGEPGTQLTLRTFHSGGVASTRTIRRAVDEKAAPNQHPPSTAGVGVQAPLLPADHSDATSASNRIANSDITGGLAKLDRLFSLSVKGQKAALARIDGHVSFGPDSGNDRCVIVTDPQTGSSERHDFPNKTSIIVTSGDSVRQGEPLTEGSIDARELFVLCGPSNFQQRFVDSVQAILAEHGVSVHDKHLEIIVMQMLRAVRITDPGDTRFVVKDDVDKRCFEEENERVEKLGGKPAEAKQVLLGITNPKTTTGSPLANASFREPASALTNAAAYSVVDPLQDFRECLMTGKLIPAGTGFEAYRKLEPKAAIPTPSTTNEESR